ncbi:metal-sensitive transcriptional regulator [Mycobacterium szulgai]|nr:metal-sensitive transcriptional regulator [Mycobacterium szulgai]
MELTTKRQAALNPLKTVRGHLDGIIRMLESDADGVDLMKQISAVQSSLERANRVMLHNRLETCFSAVLDCRGQAAIEELIDAVKFTPALSGPQVQLGGAMMGDRTSNEPAPAGDPYEETSPTREASGHGLRARGVQHR